MGNCFGRPRDNSGQVNGLGLEPISAKHVNPTPAVYMVSLKNLSTFCFRSTRAQILSIRLSERRFTTKKFWSRYMHTNLEPMATWASKKAILCIFLIKGKYFCFNLNYANSVTATGGMFGIRRRGKRDMCREISSQNNRLSKVKSMFF